MQDIGFVHYWWRHDYQAAAELVRAGQRRAGRAVVAALAGGDDAGAGRRPAVVADDVVAIRESAEIDWLRHDAERRLLQLDALDEIDQLQATVDRSRSAHGRAAV